MNSINQLQVNHLSCQRGERILFNDVNLCFQSGDFVQIEGHNGVGKTTLLRALSGLSRPREGEVLWNNEPILQQQEEFNQNLLFLGHHSGTKPELSAWENLRFSQKTTNSRQQAEVLWETLQVVGLLGYEDIPASQLSAGQQKRVALARLWLSTAPLWILDEPFNAIDKRGVQVLTNLFEFHISQGGIVIITSHQDVPSRIVQKVQLEKYKFIESE
ncbi:cytochrome c biogenesis heme-transporting ATPase CcmA [Gallibacterium anatis]|uniref:Cytochrome c biogenesis heme-transporting ATPase CcmA n=1 Tax=Gallibacterium anatis TaxID=750 RepID=A0AAX3X9I6_9PAST|nr:cytochrome c biogenesis heme-transporting ATPase CcmA [Gallibacterium anatis]MDK9429932.1 cytochrome c biogenesis heme-transporting ATPase CcmA [Gallibacterium anatis]MDK9560271.1 cytochrome c biogenesis heme-transporting ATPase CcmA [Gallibacterium anatis]UZD15250.1 cytochrome c biogenesis heme-transporting ATPase CcmA [Gallibacterium anatis]WAX70671.1 cytochrome c biogenesis heme-transporting ATPase CcmA [Gallibacterium anatis]WIM78868.1 cytochrome c biogenesis heme-transporting ATPase Cc